MGYYWDQFNILKKNVKEKVIHLYAGNCSFFHKDKQNNDFSGVGI